MKKKPQGLVAWKLKRAMERLERRRKRDSVSPTLVTDEDRQRIKKNYGEIRPSLPLQIIDVADD